MIDGQLRRLTSFVFEKLFRLWLMGGEPLNRFSWSLSLKDTNVGRLIEEIVCHMPKSTNLGIEGNLEQIKKQQYTMSHR